MELCLGFGMAAGSITESIYLEVRFAVLSGRYLPAQILDRDDLCQTYNCKSAIVVDALNALVVEGYLDVPRRGVFGVRPWLPAEINDLFDIRSSMMGMAAARAAERGSDVEIGHLTQLIGRGATFDFSNPAGTEDLIVRSAEIQGLIVKMARVATISEMARNMGPNALLRKSIWAQSQRQLARKWKSLAKVCKLIAARAPSDAQTAMTQYVACLRAPLVAASRTVERMDWPDLAEIIRIECDAISNGCAYGAGRREAGLDGRIIAFGAVRPR